MNWDDPPTAIRSARFGLTKGGLSRYVVSLHEDKGDKFQLVFECLAEDHDHAEEQAINAYPRGEIIHTVEAVRGQHRDDGRGRCTDCGEFI